MLPGYLHFDVRRGLRAEMLNASMAALLSDHTCVRETLDSLGLQEVTYRVNDSAYHGINGRTVHCYLDDRQIGANCEPNRILAYKTLATPQWDTLGLSEIKNQPKTLKISVYQSDFLGLCTSGELVSLDIVKELFLDKKVRPSTTALALKIIGELQSSLFVEQKLQGCDALWLVCQLAMLIALVEALDPKFITASKICLGEKTRAPKAQDALSLTDDTWLNTVITFMPIIDTDEAIDADVVAVAFLKSLVGQFGPRGESSILNIGVGLGQPHFTHSGHIEALWCEAHLPESMSEVGPNNAARLNFLYEISGMVFISFDMAHLIATLSLHGATSISWHLVYGEKNTTGYMVRFFCLDEDKRDAMEAFLVKACARDVSLRLVERHELNQRVVSVPLGTGNKTTSARFHEYIYYDKTVRVEPLQEDLEHYMQKTDYSIDVARADLLLIWKKWRGRVASEA